ncbi:DNA-binding transcriptional regulator, MarR family [Desulfacinum hydrothermale DSM 13146]|uniref:DNA-binding transcriptional regulator, MarR family n=1 Tax=Desulfacinum hydrothermale DSM 13146 TaxID=1121390 RepID=A0A1W1XH56_9BACT|nr:MarR family transcriptional regulator [Desulfacinum hydrothermale]SMC23104.1 DNA-binding transcriptional regulator, MarR family [Desulfacinum hydrothermale DSM 13146]
MVDPTVVHITKRLRQIARELDIHSKHIQETYKITVPQLICLREIHEYGPISLGALTKIVFLNSSTVTGIVDRLEKRNLVRRTRVSKDRRKIHVEITEDGVEFIKNAPTPLQDTFVKRLQQLSEEEVQAILWAIERLVQLLTSDAEGIPEQPVIPVAGGETPAAKPEEPQS